MKKKLLFTLVALMASVCMNLQAATVDYTVDEVGTDFITITFTPDADAAGYAICLFEAGTAEQQFAMFGPWMGFQTMGDMIIIPVTTASMGGDGEAVMTIQIGEFGGDEEYGYYQWVTYTPNENVALHRDIIILESAYESEEWGMENLLNYLKQDNPFDPYWDQYGVDEAQWNVEPNTWYIAFSIGKNAKGEWGPLAAVEFKTPGTSGINEAVTGKQVAGVRYYNMAGQEMSEANGLTIVVTTYTDGSSSAVKVMK